MSDLYESKSKLISRYSKETKSAVKVRSKLVDASEHAAGTIRMNKTTQSVCELSYLIHICMRNGFAPCVVFFVCVRDTVCTCAESIDSDTAYNYI